MAVLTGLFTLGGDGELRVTPKGDSVMRLSLAYNYGRPVNGGKPATQWISATLWGKRAESLQPYLLKGTKIFAVISDVAIQVYDKKDGTQGFSMVGNINDLEFGGGKREAGQDQGSRAPGLAAPQQTNEIDDFNDDLPF